MSESKVDSENQVVDLSNYCGARETNLSVRLVSGNENQSSRTSPH